MTDETLPSESVGLGSVVNRIGGLLQHGGGAITTGDVAALRRMDPRKPAAAFFKLVGLVLDEQLPGQPSGRLDAETRWASVIVGIAHIGGLHRPGERLGRALVDAGFSELRFARLLRADADRLVDELPALARFLAAKNVAADWGDAAWLILSAGHAGEESARRRFARDYYRALASKESGKSNN